MKSGRSDKTVIALHFMFVNPIRSSFPQTLAVVLSVTSALISAARPPGIG